MKFEDGVAFGLPAALSVVGGTLTIWMGGWDMLLQLLVVFVLLDYVTGVLAAIKTKSLSSDVMYWGGIRKGVTLAVIMVAVLFDGVVNNGEPVFRTIALYFYIGREGLSLVENVAKLGVPLPLFVKKALKQFSEKGGK